MNTAVHHFKTYIHCSQFFNAASVILLVLAMLGGAGSAPPFNFTYFLEAETAGIQGARDRTRWTFFRVCGIDDDGYNDECSGAAVAPLAAWRSEANGLPSQIAGPLDDRRVREDLYAVWMAAWWLTFIIILNLVAKLFDSLNRHKWSGMNIQAGRVLRYGPVVLLVPNCGLFIYIWVSFQAAFNSDDRSANVGPAGFGFYLGGLGALVVCEGFLFELRREFRRTYERFTMQPV